MIRFVFVLLLVAGSVYLLIRAIQRRNAGGVAWGPARREQQLPERRAVAPDDDDQFLRDLDRRRRDQGEPPSSGS